MVSLAKALVRGVQVEQDRMMQAEFWGMDESEGEKYDRSLPPQKMETVKPS